MYRFIWIFLALCSLPALGMAYQSVGSFRDKRRFLESGTLVDIGEGQLRYVLRKGTGAPTVIFESGIAATSQNWSSLQESVSSFADTLSYDRGGLGWSSECHSERTPSNIVRELRMLLSRIGVPPPYVLVGHSFGGLVVRQFAAQHPDEVVGVILLDPMRPEDWPPINQTQSSAIERGLRLTRIAVPAAQFGLARLAITSLLRRSGRLSRLIGRAAGGGSQHVLDRITCEVGKMPRDVWPIVAAHWSTPKFYRGLAAHLLTVPATVREMHDAKPIIGIPVLLLTAANAEPLSNDVLHRIGSAARQVTAEESSHWVHLDEPDLVLQSIRTVVEEIRDTALRHVETI